MAYAEKFENNLWAVCLSKTNYLPVKYRVNLGKVLQVVWQRTVMTCFGQSGRLPAVRTRRSGTQCGV